MAFVDELAIEAKAGRGGDGVVRWLHLKGKEFSGPAGGDGGRGGDVYVRAISDIGLLARYRGVKIFKAEDGAPGEEKGKHGRKGEDLIIDLPVGSLVTNKETGERYELIRKGQKVLILKGGRGGIGNAAFKSSINRSPTHAVRGGPGESAVLSIELRLFADAGLVGLPNAGKTSLLNALTGAGGKVGAYPFTTLDPNLGALHGFILADIPGLIEGASVGRGLGSKFLRHVARTRVILHCVSLDSADHLGDYAAVRKELSEFEDGALAHKPEIIILTKSDTRTPAEIERVRKLFEREKKRVEVVSVFDDASVKRLNDTLVAILR